MAPIVGMAAILRQAYDGGDLSTLAADLIHRIAQDPGDAGAWLDLSTVLLAGGQREQGLEMQDRALGLRRVFHRPGGCPGGFRVLAIFAPGDFMANTPVDFLLPDIDLYTIYVDREGCMGPAPAHDVAFLAAGESVANSAILSRLTPTLDAWDRPVVNASPLTIAGLTRDGVSSKFADALRLVCPATARARREDLLGIVATPGAIQDLLPGCGYPLVLRPIGTHAGRDFGRVESADGLAAYLQVQTGDEFYLSPFIDYRSADGQFRKQRIVFIDGRPFPSHLAVSDHWMVHYLSADMETRPERRAEEEAWMQDFETVFAVRHAAAFGELTQRLGLDYFGIDCAEMPDGRLLVFEIDVAMIVHDLDSAETFPYKPAAMKRLFEAFLDLLRLRASLG